MLQDFDDDDDVIFKSKRRRPSCLLDEYDSDVRSSSSTPVSSNAVVQSPSSTPKSSRSSVKSLPSPSACIAISSNPIPKSIVSQKKSERPLPDPFPLPENFCYDVEVALKSGKMTRETTKSFYSTVASSMLSYKRYPTQEEYTRVAVEIVNKYPFLKSPSGSSVVS